MAEQGKYTHFKELIKSNFEALDAQGAYHNYFMDSKPKEEITSTHRRLFLSIAQMANNYLEMTSNESRENVYGHICRIEGAVSPLVEMVKAARHSKYVDSRLWGRMSDEFYHKVEDLSEHMQKPDDPKFSLEECVTPHDLIRYFHQKGIDSMFKSIGSASEAFSSGEKKDNMKYFNGNEIYASIIDLDDSLKGLSDKNALTAKNVQGILSRPLATVLSFYTTKEAKSKPGTENYKILVTKDSINAHVSLGCHSAELNAQFFDGRDNIISLRFVNTTGYDYSKNRNIFVRDVLRGLGFEIEEDGHITDAKMQTNDKAKAEKTLADIVRLIASTRDLDVSSGGLTDKKRVDVAVKGFIEEGVVNIPDYLNKYKGWKKFFGSKG